MLATLVVQNNLDGDLATLAGDGELSLREAIEIANTGATIDGFTSADAADTIEFDPAIFTGAAASLVRLTAGELEITDTLTIDGSTGVDVTITGDASGDDIVDPSFITDVFRSRLNDNSGVLYFSANTGSLHLAGITITGGHDTGFAFGGGGGGIRFLSDGALRLDNSVVSGNRDSGFFTDGGGGIFTDAGDVMLSDSVVTRNGSAGSGGGVHTVSGNVSLTNSQVSHNRSEEAGGGIATLSGAVSITNSVVKDNTTDRYGGGVSSDSGAITIAGSTVDGNAVGNGGGISRAGGGIRTRTGAVVITASTISNNTLDTSVGGSGGGVSATFGDVTIERSTISNNEAISGAGGGLAVAFGELAVHNSTISGNYAFEGGGGVRARSGNLTVSNSTIANNGAPEGLGGGLLIDANVSSLVSIRNSIIANNQSGTAEASGDLQLPAESQLDIKYSLIGDTTGLAIDASTGVGNLLNVDPLLGLLADNGGPTPTHALLPGSPAFDTGDSTSATDQRGLPRPFDFLNAADGDGNLSDIGAVEMQVAADSPSLIVTTDSDSVDSFDGLTSLREAILYAQRGFVSDDTITFDPTVFTGGEASLIRLQRGELEITQTLIINGSTGVGVTISADSNNDDITNDENITDVAATIGVSSSLLSDNTRVLNFTGLSGDLTIEGISITGGAADGSTSVFASGALFGGGGIRFFSNGVLTLTGSRVAGNSISGRFNTGGGVYSREGAVVLNNSAITGNLTSGEDGRGGGISAISGPLSLTNSIVTNNRTLGSRASGGGLFSSSGDVTITGSTISQNSSNGNGGGLFSSRDDVVITNTTLSENSSRFSGGGVVAGGATLKLFESTVFENVSGDGGGGGIHFFDGELNGILTLDNTIVAGNTVAAGAASPDLLIEPESAHAITFSLIGNTAGLDIDATTGTGNLLNVDPLLGPLADNGGPTLSHAPLPGSPVINRGDPSFVTTGGVDQRGNPFIRVAGGVVDIGAIESQGAPTHAVGDYNRDGRVDLADYTAWRDNLAPKTPVNPLSGADGNGDGFVTLNDYDIWRSHVGFEFTPPTQSVAAPTATVTPPPVQQPAFVESESDTQPATLATLITPSVASATIGPTIPAQAARADSPSDAALLLLVDPAPAGNSSTSIETAARDDAFSEENADEQDKLLVDAI